MFKIVLVILSFISVMVLMKRTPKFGHQTKGGSLLLCQS